MNPSRRTMLKAGGVTALGALVGPRAVSRGLAATREDDDADPELRLDNIQGNILGGFNKDAQQLLFFRFGEAARARSWLGSLLPEVATAREVLAFNDSFRAARRRRGSETDAPAAAWTNVALTHAGLAALDLDAEELEAFPEAFREGMVARAAVLGDVDESAPANWVGPFGDGDVHGVVLLAADDEAALARLGRRHRSAMAAAGVTVAFDQPGRAREDQLGHEHFGFRDGISQPGIRGVTERQNADDDGQGVPGQDLLWPGEFVLGYPTQVRTPDPDDGSENESPGPVSTSGPDWTVDGSYLVFRRLRQDVAGFRHFVAQAAGAQGLSEDQMGAKLVGRYPSGAPLAATELLPGVDTTAGDPSVDTPELLDPEHINDFEFAEDDPEGLVVPRGAHIRKVYPRDDRTTTGREADTQTHRILRRGIPFGRSYDPAAPASSATGAEAAFPDDRGLVFLCYQSSIERQFEFITRTWVNDPDAPTADAGQDPVIAQSDASRTFTLPGGRPDHLSLMQRFVTTTGGAYLFAPSVDGLRRLAGDDEVRPPRRDDRRRRDDRQGPPPRGRRPRRPGGR